MTDFFTQTWTDVSTAVHNAVTTVHKEVSEKVTYVGRKVEQLADDHLHPRVAEVAKQAFWGLPFTAASLLLPFPVSLALWVGYGIANIAMKQPFSPDVRDAINSGVGNAFLIKAAHNAFRCVITANPTFAIAALIDLAMGSWFHAAVPADRTPSTP